MSRLFRSFSVQTGCSSPTNMAVGAPPEEVLASQDYLAGECLELACWTVTERCGSMKRHEDSYPLSLALACGEGPTDSQDCLNQFKVQPGWEL